MKSKAGIHTNSQMGIDTGITSSTGKILVLAVRDMEMRFWVTVFLGQTKVNHVDLIATLANSHQEVVGLDVTMNEGLGMDILDAGDELIRKKQNRLQGELPVAEVEEVLQARSKKVKNHRIVVTLGTEPANERDADTSGK